MKNICLTFALIFVILNSACSKPQRRFEEDKTQASYHEGNTGGVEVSKVGDTKVSVGALPVDAILSAPQYYSKTTIEGDCRLKTSETDLMDIPCHNIPLTLVDSKGNEVTRVYTQDGKFTFKPSDSKTYRIGVASKNFQLQKEVKTNLGDRPFVHLLKKQ